MAGVMNLTGYIVVGHHHAQADVFTRHQPAHRRDVRARARRSARSWIASDGARRSSGASPLMAVSTRDARVRRARSLWTSVSLFLLGLGWNLSYISATAELVTHATPVERGRLVGFTDLVAGLLAAALALLGGVAYTEWGVVAVAVGATLAVGRARARDPRGPEPPAVAPEPVG